MKQSLKPLFLSLTASFILVMSSCKKETSSNVADDNTTALQAAVSATQAVAVSTTSSGDTVYITGTCSPHSKRDSIGAASLPSAISTYLTTNYSGYTFSKAFKITDAAGTTTQGYVVVINYNGSPVGLKFDASGNFVKVLEQREAGDLTGAGYHKGGRFEHRDGKQRDTVALSSLPSAVTSYFSTKYASDTIVRAVKTKENGYVIISKNAGLSATLFDASGSFVARVELPLPKAKGKIESVEATALPAAITTYLTNTYPGYVFTKAFSIAVNGTVQGYCVAIEANSTRYALLFDATGTFVAMKTIR